MPGPCPCLDPQKRALRPLRAAVARLVRGAGPAFFLINRFSVFRSPQTFSAWRAQGWPLAAMSAGLPVGTLRPCLTPDGRSPTGGKCRPSFCYLAAGQPVLTFCLGCWFLCPAALVPHWCGFWPGWWCSPARLAALQQTGMAAGHPFIGRGSRPKVGGTPKGCPGRRPLCGARFFAVG